jgi:hypothetical protein
MCAMMQKFRMNFGSIFSVTGFCASGFLSYRQDSNRLLWIYRRACCISKGATQAGQKPCRPSSQFATDLERAQPREPDETIEEGCRGNCAAIPSV